MNGLVELSVSVTVQPVPGLVARGGGDRVHASQRGEGRLRTDPPLVRIGDKYLGGRNRPYAGEVQQAGGHQCHDLLQLLVVRHQLGMELIDGGDQPLGLRAGDARGQVAIAAQPPTADSQDLLIGEGRRASTPRSMVRSMEVSISRSAFPWRSGCVIDYK